MAHADWEPVVLSKTRGGGGGGGARGGAGAGTEKKFDAGTNRTAAAGGAGMSAKKLEEDTEHFAHATVDVELSKAIMQARLAKKMKQSDLAVAINEKASVVADYEAGRAIPNPSIMSKLDRALGVHLPRPPKKK